LASWNGKLEVVRTLLEAEADINAKDNVRNQLMMIMMMMMMIVINDEDRDVCRL
jgi:ankyrin repeat protein